MCLDTNGNQKLVCTVGDLYAGREYRTPEGDTMLVCDRPRTDDPNLPTYGGPTTVVNLRTGEILEVPSTTKLGRDRKDRLYASRYLNPPAIGVAS